VNERDTLVTNTAQRAASEEEIVVRQEREIIDKLREKIKQHTRR
jgi:hypothetical protein